MHTSSYQKTILHKAICLTKSRPSEKRDGEVLSYYIGYDTLSRSRNNRKGIKSILEVTRITNEEKISSNTSEPYQTMLERSFERQQEKEPINKEIKLLLNSQIDDYNKNLPQRPCIKVQLWSNASKSDYAIKLRTRQDILAATKKTEEYTELVEESDYLDFRLSIRLELHSQS